ncbi:tyrosine-type recombinase/integrase [Halorarum salinum]|nr:site-specific integrase [Halobaculum salinum]
MERNDKGQFEAKYRLEENTDHYEQYAEWVLLNVDKETTQDRLKAGVRAWLYWCEQQDVDPLTVEEDDVRLYIQHLQRDNYANPTITRRVASVSKYYHGLKHNAEAEWKLERNPTTDINLRKDYDIKNTSDYVTVLYREGRKDIIALGPDKIKPLVEPENIPGSNPATRTRNELIIRLFWQTAVRGDELSRFRYGNIDWDKRDIEFRSAKLNPEDHPDLYYRHVWWEPNLDYLMYRWKESHREQMNPNAGDSPYLFVTSQNGSEKDLYRMSPSEMSRIVKRAAHNAGVQEPLVGSGDDVKQWLYTAHRLRHSRITFLANDANDDEGMDLNSLRMMAGHAKFDTTLDYVKGDWETARQRFRTATPEEEQTF